MTVDCRHLRSWTADKKTKEENNEPLTVPLRYGGVRAQRS